MLWRLPGRLLPFSGFPILAPRCLCLALGCILWLLLCTLLCENILSFCCVRSSSFLVICRLFSDPTLRNSLVHTGLYYILPCIGRCDRARSLHVVGRYIYLRAQVNNSRSSGIALLPIPDCGAVLCAALCCLPVEKVVIASFCCMSS